MEQQSATEATLVFKAAIADHWHMYSQFTPEGGSLPLEFIFEKNNGYTLIGKTSEYPKPLVKFSDVFGVDEWIFEHAVTFKQKVKLNGAKEIKGNIYYQVCKEACINGDTNFVFKFENNSLPKNLDTAKVILDTATIAPTIDTTASIQANVPADCIQAEVALAQESNGAIFAKGFLGGLVALLTPCVFSMIPLTVSFFIKRSGNKKKGIRNASLYSSFIVGIFIALGFVMSKVFGADALNAAASDIYVNLAFFIIFLIFAASFFGAFELTLPTSWINKADAASDRGGILGIFFMALTLVLVSFSCTAPVIGGLLALVSQGGNNLGALIGMAGFAIALALPFTLFALFPAWLNSLPKSGGWMNVIKVSLGFVELALALKFLSNVDMAYKWEFLHRELFIALWIIIFGLWGWYLLGKLKFAHDDDTTHLGVGRLLSAVLVLAFTIYLVPGLWGSPLKLISGFPPPDFYKEWKTSTSE
ncbi:MAG: Thiol:disulfide interchange protein DsbD, partial [Bacteroidota bacterium]